MKQFGVEMLSTGRGVIRVRCEVWPGGTKMHNFVFRQNAAAFCLYAMNGVRRMVIVVVRCRISRERFNIESPNFTSAFTPVGSTATSDMTSHATSIGIYRSSKNDRKCRIRQHWVEF